MKRILFVCTGNTCRSPMAAAAFQQLATAAGLDGLEVASAGLEALAGEPMPPQAGFALHQAGFEPPAEHRSRPLTTEAARAADLILVMTRPQLETLHSRFPEAAPHARLLLTCLENTPRQADLPDPFGGDSETYVACLARMLPALHGLVNLLRAAAPD